VPKAAQYKADSVIYFQGDIAEKIFILKTGKVLLKSNDIETGEEYRELIATGEFFGVKSALGKYTRDETAMAVSDAELLLFSVVEFEQLVLSNTRIIMKMLKVFSNQLRRIHHKVQSLISKGEQTDPETGLYSIGEYYLKNRQWQQALYGFDRYLTYYPSGKHAAKALQYLQTLNPAKGETPSSSLTKESESSIL
jgi:CRP-like cAMP-binding protein